MRKLLILLASLLLVGCSSNNESKSNNDTSSNESPSSLISEGNNKINISTINNINNTSLGFKEIGEEIKKNVEKVENTTDLTNRYALVSVAVNFKKLETVLVITNK